MIARQIQVPYFFMSGLSIYGNRGVRVFLLPPNKRAMG